MTEPEPAPQELDEEQDEPVRKPKQRLPSETNVKKEHLNIVFIGHVGK